jgi:hypothetical protein
VTSGGNLYNGGLKVRAATQIAVDSIGLENRARESKVVVVVQGGGSLESESCLAVQCGGRCLVFGDGSEQVQSDSPVAVACNDVREMNIYTAGGENILNSRKGPAVLCHTVWSSGVCRAKVGKVIDGMPKIVFAG